MHNIMIISALPVLGLRKQNGVPAVVEMGIVSPEKLPKCS